MNIRSDQRWYKRFFGGRLISLGQIAAVFALGFLVHWIWPTSEPSVEGAPEAGARADGEAETQKWTCSMHPQIQKDGPGACPICGMDLIPLTSGKTMGLRFLVVTPESRELMNLEVTPVERKFVEAEVRMVGKVEYDETRLKYITAWVSGRLDVLFVNFTGVSVKKGDHMADIYSEELYSAQQELIEAVKSSNGQSTRVTQGIDLLGSAREKLWLLGLSRKKIAEIEAKKKPDVHIEISAPMGGTVVEKLRQQGDRVKIGDRIYGIADLSHLWIKLDAYESDLAWIRYGQKVEITTEAYRGMKPLEGKVVFIDPVLDKKTRTVKIRVNIDNKKGLLKPEMFVHAVVRAKVAGEGRVIDPGLAKMWVSPMHPEIIKDKPGTCDICGMPLVTVESQGYVVASDRDRTMPLVIPVSAALLTGTRAIVYVELPNFPREVLDAYQRVSDAMAEGDKGDLATIRAQFAALKTRLPRVNTLLRTDFERMMWTKVAGRIWEAADSGEKAASKNEARHAFDATKKALDRLRESFSPQFPRRILEDYQQLSAAMADGDLAKIGKAFAALKSALPKNNTLLRTDRARAQWKTMAGPIWDAADSGEKAASENEAKQAFDATKKALDEMRNRFFPQFPAELLERYDQVSEAMANGDLAKIRRTFAALKRELPKDNKLLRTDYARILWTKKAGRIWDAADSGEKAASKYDAQQAFDATKKALDRLQEHFSTPDKPTFAGRQVVLGPRAGDFYLVRHGLAEGEIVVSRGNFKIDSALQIAAKPSMMTPEGGGAKNKDSKQPGDGAELPLTMRRSLNHMLTLAKSIKQLMQKRDLKAVRKKYSEIGGMIAGIDADSVEGEARLYWNEFQMLLENDVNEGGRVKHMSQADAAFVKLQKTLSRVDDQFGISSGDLGPMRYDVPSRFQQQLAGAWQAYLGLGSALAGDNAKAAASKTGELTAALAKVDMKLLTGPAHIAWMRELDNLRKTLKKLSSTKDIQKQRKQFASLSGVMQVLALSFGFGDQNPVYQLHCSMAFNKKGAYWLQSNTVTRNPYYGNEMLTCADPAKPLLSGKKPVESPVKKNGKNPQ
ncbi:MAG: efflux RND transporter periplasmic adaptor subunit [Planctomycetaceae bacterium]